MFEIKQVVVVIAVSGNNPTVLSEEFLRKVDVVPNDWATNSVLVTPPLSQVSFTNGFIVTMELNHIKIEVSDSNLLNFDFGVISAQKLTTALPHLRYRATGINFHAAATSETAAELLRGKLLRNEDQEGLSNLQLSNMQWTGQVGNVKLTMNFDVFIEDGNEVLMTRANYHRESETVERVFEALTHFDEDLADYGLRLGRLLG